MKEANLLFEVFLVYVFLVCLLVCLFVRFCSLDLFDFVSLILSGLFDLVSLLGLVCCLSFVLCICGVFIAFSDVGEGSSIPYQQVQQLTRLPDFK